MKEPKKNTERKLIVLRDLYEEHDILECITVTTDMTEEEIDDAIVDAKCKARETSYDDEWMVSDVIENLPSDWNVEYIETCEAYI